MPLWQKLISGHICQGGLFTTDQTQFDVRAEFVVRCKAYVGWACSLCCDAVSCSAFASAHGAASSHKFSLRCQDHRHSLGGVGATIALKCRSCKKGRYAPPVHMIKLTREREIAPYVWPIWTMMIGDNKSMSRAKDALESIKHWHYVP